MTAAARSLQRYAFGPRELQADDDRQCVAHVCSSSKLDEVLRLTAGVARQVAHRVP